LKKELQYLTGKFMISQTHAVENDYQNQMLYFILGMNVKDCNSLQIMAYDNHWYTRTLYNL